MALQYSRLTVNGSEVQTGGAARLRLVRLSLDYEGRHELEISEGPGAATVPSLSPNSTIKLEFNRAGTAVTAFLGRIMGVYPTFAGNGWHWGYRCLGLPHAADFVPILNPSGTNRYHFNEPEDSEERSDALSGLTVGGIISKVLTDHASVLSEIGVQLTYLSEFAALDHTPLDPIEVSGESVWNWLQSFVARWAPNHRAYIQYVGNVGEIRLADLAAPATTTSIVAGQEKVQPPVISCDISSCASQVRIVGDEEIEPYLLSLSAGELEKAWTSSEQTAWKLTDWSKTETAQSVGTVSSMTESAVVVDPTDNARTWAANAWAGTSKGKLRLKVTPIAGVTTQQTRSVSSNTTLTAGGTSTINVDTPFTLNTFTTYELYKKKLGRDHVWRALRPTDADLRAKIRSLFPKDTVYKFNSGSAAIGGIRTPLAFLVIDGVRYQALVEIDKGTGTIWFTEPYVSHTALGNPREDLDLGTIARTPDDVVVFLPVAVSRIETTYPDSPAGKAYDWYGLNRKKTVFLPNWRDRAATTQIRDLAEVLHTSLKDPAFATSLTVHGFRGHEFLPWSRGVTLSAKQGPGGATVDLGRAGEVTYSLRSLVVEWGGPDAMRCKLGLSTDRRPALAAELYTHGISGNAIDNNWLPFDFGLEEGESMAFGGANLDAVDQTASSLRRLFSDPIRQFQDSIGRLGPHEKIEFAQRLYRSAYPDFFPDPPQADPDLPTPVRLGSPTPAPSQPQGGLPNPPSPSVPLPSPVLAPPPIAPPTFPLPIPTPTPTLPPNLPVGRIIEQDYEE